MNRDDPLASDTGGPDQGVGEQLLSIGEAALRYGVAARKINKLVYENQLDGARKVRGAHGMEWRVPVAELEARGYRPVAPPADQPNVEVAELQRTVRTLTDALVRQRQRWDDKHRELEDALLVIGQLKADLRRERERRERVENQLADLRPELVRTESVIDLRLEQETQSPQRRP